MIAAESGGDAGHMRKRAPLCASDAKRLAMAKKSEVVPQKLKT
jgi:hypothetical protein